MGRQLDKTCNHVADKTPWEMHVTTPLDGSQPRVGKSYRNPNCLKCKGQMPTEWGDVVILVKAEGQ